MAEPVEYEPAGNGDANATKRHAKYATRYMDLFLATKAMDRLDVMYPGSSVTN